MIPNFLNSDNFKSNFFCMAASTFWRNHTLQLRVALFNFLFMNLRFKISEADPYMFYIEKLFYLKGGMQLFKMHAIVNIWKIYKNFGNSFFTSLDDSSEILVRSTLYLIT